MVTFVERWAGRLLRWLMAYLFLGGVILTIDGLLHLRPGAVAFMAFGIPYLAIRYRDPESTTVPGQYFVRRLG